MKTNKRGQQEMVGFVLIVVLVVVGLMVFLTISVRNRDSSEIESVSTSNLLSSVMKYTTKCAITFEPKYDSFEDLFKSCYQNKRCSNLGDKPACLYLNESLKSVMSELIKTEATVSGYEVSFFEKDGEGILQIRDGECENSPTVSSAQRNLIAGSTSLIVRLKICNKA